MLPGDVNNNKLPVVFSWAAVAALDFKSSNSFFSIDSRSLAE